MSLSPDRKQPLTRNAIEHYWKRKLYLEGLIDVKVFRQEGLANRYGVNTHLIRSVFRSQFMLSPVAESLELHVAVPDFMQGHAIDPLPYKRIQNIEPLIAEYRNALPYLNLLSNPNPAKWVGKSEVEFLKRKVRELEQGSERSRKLDMIDRSIYCSRRCFRRRSKTSEKGVKSQPKKPSKTPLARE
jgi:hypothetical protein